MSPNELSIVRAQFERAELFLKYRKYNAAVCSSSEYLSHFSEQPNININIQDNIQDNINITSPSKSENICSSDETFCSANFLDLEDKTLLRRKIALDKAFLEALGSDAQQCSADLVDKWSTAIIYGIMSTAESERILFDSNEIALGKRGERVPRFVYCWGSLRRLLADRGFVPGKVRPNFEIQKELRRKNQELAKAANLAAESKGFDQLFFVGADGLMHRNSINKEVSK